jgi:hypothetical protein
MVYSAIIEKRLDKIFFKLSKKNKTHLRIIDRKIEEILDNPYKFKPLRGDYEEKMESSYWEEFCFNL